MSEASRAISTEQLAVINLAVKTKLLVDSIDGALAEECGARVMLDSASAEALAEQSSELVSCI